MNPVVAWVRLVRPPIVFISILGALVGALNVAHVGLEGVWIALSAGLMGAGLMVHNDVTDLESDRINRPHKPLCCGAIRPRTARWVGLGMMGASVVLAAALSLYAGILMATITAVGVWYNTCGKLEGIWGHVAVAFGVGAIPLFGAFCMGELWAMVPLALAIGVMEVGREIMVCVGDYHGDLKAGWRTTPVRIGRRRAMVVALIFYLVSVPLWYIPYQQGVFGPLYLATAMIFVAVLLGTWAYCWEKVRHVQDAMGAYKQPAFCGLGTAFLNLMNGNPESVIWRRFELSIRTGTRVAIVALQVVLLLEVWI